jgi:hypothetical protein
MPQLEYNVCKQFMEQQFPYCPAGIDPEFFIRSQAQLGGFPEYADQLVGEFIKPTIGAFDAQERTPTGSPEPDSMSSESNRPASRPPVSGETPASPPQATSVDSVPEPFMLFYLGNAVHPGTQLSPEFRVVFAGWNGTVRVEATLHEALDQSTWKTSPELVQEGPGIWKFFESIPLKGRDGLACLPGTYLVKFTCYFRSQGHVTSWRGGFSFDVTEKESRELVISSEGNSLTNLAAVDLTSMLRKFSKVQINTGGNALVNLQGFESALKEAPPSGGGTATMTSIKLHEFGGFRPPPDQCTEGRFDLPNGRRILLYARSGVMLGRNRPNQPQGQPTDIALRLYPRDASRDALSMLVSQQHLEIRAADGRIHLRDPRKPVSRDSAPAHANNQPLVEQVAIDHSEHGVNYTTYFKSGSGVGIPAPQLGLRIHSFRQPHSWVQDILTFLRFAVDQLDFGKAWHRDETGLDALLIERERTCDELNGREAYLLVHGIVLIGSDARCPLRIEHPSVQTRHAILCNWDLQFRIIPIDDAPVVCNGLPIRRGQVGTLRPGNVLKLGEAELTFETPQQYGLEHSGQVH